MSENQRCGCGHRLELHSLDTGCMANIKTGERTDLDDRWVCGCVDIYEPLYGTPLGMVGDFDRAEEVYIPEGEAS